MPRPALTEAQKREIRQQIRKAAATLYAENGIANISARAVAEEAGVSVGTLYAYFENLSELMQSLWREPTRRLVNHMEILARDIGCPKARLNALLDAYVNFAVNQQSVFRSAFLYVRPENQSAPKKVPLQDDQFFQLFCQTLRDGQDQDLFRKGEVAQLVQIIVSAVHGSIALPVNFHRLDLDDTEQVPRQMIDTMMEWVTAVDGA